MRYQVVPSLNYDPKIDLTKLLDYFLQKENLNGDYDLQTKMIKHALEVTKFNDTDKIYFDKTFELKLSYPEIIIFKEVHEIVKNKFDEAVWKKFEKEKFNELISSHNPDKEICLKLLENIDSFDFEDDYHIIKKLNLNKDKSENSKEIFDKTLEKFMPFLNADELNKLKIRMRFDEVFKDLQDRGIYHEKKFNEIFKASKYFDNYILENLNYTQIEILDKILDEIKTKYQKRRFTSPILTNLSNPNSTTNTPSNSVPSTPTKSASNPNFKVPDFSLSGKKFGVQISEKKSRCAIS